MASELERTGNLSGALRDHASREPDRPYLIAGEQRLSYGCVDDLVNRCCRLYAREGLGPSDIIGALIPNSVEYVVMYLASLRYGTVFNPYPFTLEVPDLLRYLAHVQPKLILCQDRHFEGLSADGSLLLYRVGTSFLDDLSSEPADPCPTFEPKERSPACLYYSSATTGNPKSVVFSYQNMVANISSILRGFDHGPEEVHLIVLPMGHTASINYSFLPCTMAGGRLVLAESFWKIRRDFWKIIAREGVTYLELVPSLLTALVNTPYPKHEYASLPSLRFIGCGSSTLPRDLQRRFIDRFGVGVGNLYGLSETGPSHVDNPLQPGWELGSIGVPLDCNECLILGEDGEPLPPKANVVGEIALRGDNVFIDYYKNPDLYAQVVLGGLFLTGDLGRHAPDGRFWFVGRKKELIIKGGINIAPDEIDEILYRLEGVESALTVGDADDYLGERIHSYIVRKEDSALTEHDVLQHCKRLLSRTKIPDRVSFVASLPKGPSGKFLRREMPRQSS